MPALRDSPSLPPARPAGDAGPPGAASGQPTEAAARLALTARIDALLPQTQCTRCGYPDCHGYAQAIAQGEADINRCPPGGAEGVQRLADATGRTARPLDPAHGLEGPRLLALIDESWCIGCTLCIKACPVDCIAGASKRMHTVIADECTGCELCVPVCPVDCIAMVPSAPAETAPPTGWQAWRTEQAQAARARYQWRTQRLARAQREHDEALAAKAQSKLADLQNQTRLTDPEAIERKRAVIEAALARARAKAGPATLDDDPPSPAG